MLSGLSYPSRNGRNRNKLRRRKKRPRGRLRYLVLLALACLLAWAFTGCTVKRTQLTAADGSVSSTREITPALKPDTKRFIADLARTWSPRPMPPRMEGSTK